MPLQRSAGRAAALLALALALALPAVAVADHGPALLDDRLGTYMAIAQKHWAAPAPQCLESGMPAIPVHAVLIDDPEPDVAARADQPGCRLWLDRSHWRTMRPVDACTIVAHEWGHLLGHDHVRNPFALMAAFPERPPPGCTALAQTGRKARASARHRARACARHRKRIRRGRSAARARAVRRHHARFACLRRR